MQAMILFIGPSLVRREAVQRPGPVMDGELVDDRRARFVEAEDLNLGIADVDGFIESLNIAGELLKCGRLYKSASASISETPSKRRR